MRDILCGSVMVTRRTHDPELGVRLPSAQRFINPMDALVFEPETHSYISLESDTKWISVTTLISCLKPPFEGKKIAEKCARNTKSKWFGMTPDNIQQAWKAESDRAINLGTWYHEEREKDLLSFQTINIHGKDLPVIHPIFDEKGRKMAPTQKLTDGIYPEHFVYLKSAGVCGQSDLVEVVDGKVYITDYKTNKEIKTAGFKNWEGVTAKMNPPVSHLDDCNYNHYALQLSTYMYMILKHNPKLDFGGMMIHHIQFEEKDQTDMYGYPITMLTPEGNPIVKRVVEYAVPYLRDEVISILHHLQDNPSKFVKKK